jgi:hypothetical protein
MMRFPTRLISSAAVLALLSGIAAGSREPARADALDPCSASFNQFGVGNWPPACWRPYSDSSPFNQPIPPNPRLDPRSAEIVNRLLGFGPPNPERAGIADTGDDYSQPVYFAQSGDPVVTLRGSGGSPIDGYRIRVPAEARPAGGSDHHMTIVEPDGWEYDLYHASAVTGGEIHYDSGRRIRIDGDGLNSAATAARFGNIAGGVRAVELQAGQINHALVMAVHCTSGRFVWPAAKTDSKCSDPTDAPPMGARFQLAMSDAQIAALSVPGWKKTILGALAHYGSYVGDSTSSPWSVTGFESGSTFTSFGIEDPMVAFARQVGIKPTADGVYVFDIAHGVDWARYLRVIEPGVARGGAGARSAPPRLWALSVKPRSLRRRITISYRLSRPATVTFSFLRVSKRSKSGRRCRKRRACTRYVGSFSVKGRAGLNRKRFRGRLGGRKLRNGSYRVGLVAADGGTRSRARQASFRVRRR